MKLIGIILVLEMGRTFEERNTSRRREVKGQEEKER